MRDRVVARLLAATVIAAVTPLVWAVDWWARRAEENRWDG